MRSGRVRAGRAGAVVAAVLVLGACSSGSGGTGGYGGSGGYGGGSSDRHAGYGSAGSTTSAVATGADLAVASTSLGRVVVDRQGRTAYYFDKDEAGSGTSACSGDCLAAWPAIAPAGATPSVDGVTAKVGTIKRDDGTSQITLGGRPVYLFVKDTAPGQVTGQGVGGVWHVVAPDGSEVRTSAAG